MAKIKIPFNGAEFSIDESALASATSELKTHLSTTMNGTGATINLDGVPFSVDSTKLSTATNGFVTHLGTVAGNGSKVVVNGVEYAIDSAKLAGAVSSLEAALGNLTGSDDMAEIDVFPLQTLNGFVEDTSIPNSAYVHICEIFEIKEGETYYVDWDGTTYTCKGIIASYEGSSIPYIGNGSALGFQGNNEPFAIINFVDQFMAFSAFNDLSESHDVRVYQKVDGKEERLEGDGAEFHQFAPTVLSFRSTAPLNELKEVKIDGVTVDSSNYTLEEGSTIVTFPISYLQNLNKGNYEVTVESENKSANGEFTVVVPEKGELGVYYNLPYYTIIDGMRKFVFILREDGTVQARDVLYGIMALGTYIIEDANVTIVVGEDTYTGRITDDGIYCNEFDATFILNNEIIAADGDYLYFYSDAVNGYGAVVIDNDKSSYGPIKTNINGQTTSLYWQSYARCSNLTHITIPNGVVGFGESAFYECENLISATLPEGPTNLGSETFYNCKSLTKVNIPNSITAIGAHVFCGCESLANINIPDTVTVIHNSAFADCTNLTEVTIGAGVTSIGDNAFTNCSKLDTIIFNGTVIQWNAITCGFEWITNVPATYVQCSDGQVSLV